MQNQPLSNYSPKTNRSIFTVSPKSTLSFHFPLLAIFSHWTFCLTPSVWLSCLLKLTHFLVLTHTHTHSALACESCEGLWLAFSIWLCFCCMCERSEWRRRTETHAHSPDLSLSLQRFCKLSLFMSVLENLSLCWQGYGEIRCFFVVVFFITCKLSLWES